ncbi:hypothetical protein VPNG_05775 [Cytospora leucostoma]|uniref:SRR1-like domain-containing protein n=1 Tax=Cytospora leucostoma TaxID=1230097 RepID=A0A423X075_9PEZI|nr:hypothetical protein VPNG_05775 [Cytospora leucostoma]
MESLQVANRVRALYQRGVPFFTRGAIQDLAHQLDRARGRFNDDTPGDSEEKFSLQSLDGRGVEIDNETGNTQPYFGTRDIIMIDPFLDYQPYQHLIAVHKDVSHFFPKLAYCPLRINYHACQREMSTKEVLPYLNCQPLETVQEVFRAGIKAWEDSEDCRRLSLALTAPGIPGSITKVVAFACSTIAGGPVRDTSVRQHAMLLTIRSILQSRLSQPSLQIECYGQDPVYTEVDREVLGKAGITVLPDPRGFLEVDDSSVVLSFSPDAPVRQIVVDLARPAVLVWDKVMSEEETLQFWSDPSETWETLEELEGTLSDPESPRLRRMIQTEYVEVGSLDELFGQARIYVRRSPRA